MKNKLNVLLALLFLGFSTSCFDDRDDNGIFASQINDFVWKGMNVFYLYKSEIPDLSDDRFSTNAEYGDYLNSYDSPEQLFESLIYERHTVDKYSWIVDDYIALEQQLLGGVSQSNGMKYGLRLVPGSQTELYGYVRYVLPGTSAETEGLQRGDIFYGVNGESLNLNNYISLLFSDASSYTINLGTYDDNGTVTTDDDSILQGSENITLTKQDYTENPIFKTEILNVGSTNVGYLMYNRFTPDFDNELNNVFSNFSSNNVQHLVLDLRYNPGGSINTASLLGSMITGSYTGQTFAKLRYNSNFNENIYEFLNTINGGSAINSLNLDKVYILALNSSASASEMTINSLRPYIEVVHIGLNTEGKSQASRTVYDSPDFNRSGANPNHTYAMQPLVGISVNKNDGIVPSTGLIPDVELAEDITNLGILGNENEPLLQRALDIIEGNRGHYKYVQPVEIIADDLSFTKFAKDMFTDEKHQKEE